MTLDHLSLGTHDLAATRFFYEGQPGFGVIILGQLLMAGASGAWRSFRRSIRRSPT
jgi:hypothetical protein